MKFDEILMMYRKNRRLTSWEALANELGMTEQGLRHIRNGDGTLKDGTLDAIMSATQLEAPLIMATWKVEHATSERVRESWARYLEEKTPRPALPEKSIKDQADNGDCILCKVDEKGRESKFARKDRALQHIGSHRKSGRSHPWDLGRVLHRPYLEDATALTAHPAGWDGMDRRRPTRTEWTGEERRAA